jgi:NADH dehydrogenase
MIFVTGATGFLGYHLITALSKWRKEVRVLISPNQDIRSLPAGIPVEIAVSSLSDETNLKAALKDVDTIFHLASDEHAGTSANLRKIDVLGTEILTKTASELNISRIIFFSHLGAEPSSAYPLLKAKGQAEQIIIKSSVPYTIFKTGPIFGPSDHFLNRLRLFIQSMPFVTLAPEKGQTLLHPVWVEDVITAAIWASENESYRNSTYEIGGSEYFTFSEIIQLISTKTGRKRMILPLNPNFLRLILLFWKQINRKLPVSSFDLDYLAMDRTAPLDTLNKTFGIQPKRLNTYLTDHQFTNPRGT